MDADQVLAFRLGRSGLATRAAGGLADAASCPLSDFARDAALVGLAARAEDVSRVAYESAVDAAELVVAHVIRGAIHAVPPADFALWGRALVAGDDAELGAQLGRQVRRLTREHRLSPVSALAEVTAATEDALADGRALGKNELHQELRQRVRAELMPWCAGCGSHHVAPMLWRYATVSAGVRLDARRRYTIGSPGPTPAASEAVRRFLRFYGPATVGDFADWAGLARPHAERLWDECRIDLSDVEPGRALGQLLREDLPALASPPAAEGIRLLPPGDPYLQRPNRPLLAPDAEMRKRLFRPVASPGAVLAGGRLAGVWRAKATGPKVAIAIEKLGRLSRAELEGEAGRVAAARGLELARLVVE